MSDASRVLDRLRLQQEKYRGMVALVRAQRPAFSSMDVDGILRLIEEKRTLLAEIDAIEAELAPIKREWSRIRAGFSADEARQLDATLDGTKKVLEELVGLEDESRALLTKQREEKSEVLEGMLRMNRARGAYGAR